MMSTRWFSLLPLCVALMACSKTDANPKPQPSASAAGSGSAAPLASTSVDAGGKPAAGGAPKAEAATYAGKYTAAAAALHIPADNKDYKGVKQAPDDGSKHVGEGAMTVAVDGAGLVSGEIEAGPAAPAVIEGVLADGEIRARVRRKDPSDNGLTGTLLAKVAGSNVEGTMKLAEANASIVREAKVSLTKK
jgi:hypothetical protein